MVQEKARRKAIKKSKKKFRKIVLEKVQDEKYDKFYINELYDLMQPKDIIQGIELMEAADTETAFEIVESFVDELKAKREKKRLAYKAKEKEEVTRGFLRMWCLLFTLLVKAREGEE